MTAEDTLLQEIENMIAQSGGERLLSNIIHIEQREFKHGCDKKDCHYCAYMTEFELRKNYRPIQIPGKPLTKRYGMRKLHEVMNRVDINFKNKGFFYNLHG